MLHFKFIEKVSGKEFQARKTINIDGILVWVIMWEENGKLCAEIFSGKEVKAKIDNGFWIYN